MINGTLRTLQSGQCDMASVRFFVHGCLGLAPVVRLWVRHELGALRRRLSLRLHRPVHLLACLRLR